MKLILSPTKTMDTSGCPEPEQPGLPEFHREAGLLIRELSGLDSRGLKKLFKTSDALTQKVHGMVKGFADAPSGPALFVFRGEAFKILKPEDFNREQLDFACKNVRIFSGLYGVLAPLEEIKPYRLDFNTPLKIEGVGLKAFWKQRLIPYFESLISPGEPLINLASGEYASVISQTMEKRMITLQFREKAGGKLKNATVRAKQARGAFARHIICRKMDDPGALIQTRIEGYRYSPALSSDREWFFIR